MENMDNHENQNVTPEVEKNQIVEASTLKNKLLELTKKWWFWAIIGVLVIALIAGGSDDSNNNSGNGGDHSGGTSESSISWKNSGTYKVGVDIAAGEYYVKCTSHSCYVQLSSDSSGSFDSIIANDNISTHTYITVRDGEYLTVTGGKFALSNQIDAATPASDGTYSEGMYKVGKDIPAGEYKIVAINYCYIEVSSNSNHTFHSILTNDNIEVGTSTYITVTDGQYLTVTGGKIHVQ